MLSNLVLIDLSFPHLESEFVLLLVFEGPRMTNDITEVVLHEKNRVRELGFDRFFHWILCLVRLIAEKQPINASLPPDMPYPPIRLILGRYFWPSQPDMGKVRSSRHLLGIY